MKGVPRVLGDVLLALFAVAVVFGSYVVIDQSDDPVSAILTSEPPRVGVTPRPTPVSSTVRPSAEDGFIVVAGQDLAKLRNQLATASGGTVEVVESSANDVLPAAALEDIEGTPVAVVVQIVAGTKTSVRTAAAVNTARKRWPQAAIYVVGPFSSDDRKSAEAAKTATLAAKATFLDPVDLKWRAEPGSAVLSNEDQSVVAQRLAAALL